MKPIPNKWKFAIGTTSRVPNSGGLHYLIADFDDHKIDFGWISRFANNAILQKTPRGWHVYTDTVVPFDILVDRLRKIGVDPVWLKIGKERGYLFLADKRIIVFPWPVENMVIYDGKEKA